MHRAPPSGNKVNIRKLRCHLNVKIGSLKINAFIIKSNVLMEALRLLRYFRQMLRSVNNINNLLILGKHLSEGKQTFTRYYVKKNSLLITGNIRIFLSKSI